MRLSKRIHPAMRIPPPLLFVLAFFMGVGLQRLTGLNAPALPVVRVVGIGLVVFGAFLAFCSMATFLAARTTVIPFSDASSLVTWGPYRFTRNPMYVSLVLAYVGVALLSSRFLALVFLPVPIFFVVRIVIPFEEERMRNVFGAAYETYCSRVRRWL